MEEGLCPYCKSKVHTNDLICPECYEKITPIYDKLLHEKSKKEIELQEQSKKEILNNEEELFEYYCKVKLNENYSKKDAMKEIILKYSITNIEVLEEVWESNEWADRLKDMLKNKEQAIKFLNDEEDKLFETYKNLIINENYSKKDAENEVIKKHNITDDYIIYYLNNEIWNNWNTKIQKEKIKMKKLEKEKTKNSKSCPKCGIKNEIDNNFCINCGNKL